jgi:hypothetical protein
MGENLANRGSGQVLARALIGWASRRGWNERSGLVCSLSFELSGDRSTRSIAVGDDDEVGGGSSYW